MISERSMRKYDAESGTGQGLRWFVMLGLLLLCCVSGMGSTVNGAETDSNLEYRVKAAFLYNFTQFIDWPETAFKGEDHSIRLYVLGTDPFGPALDGLRGKTVKGKSLTVLVGEDPAAATGCHMLFIAKNSKVPAKEILQRFKNTPVLTVADTEGFCEAGGVINFVIVNNKVRFEINPNAAKQADLKISSQLLKLAVIVNE